MAYSLSYTFLPSTAANSYLYRRDSYPFIQWYSQWPRQREAPRTASVNDTDIYMEDADVRPSTLAQ